MLYMKMRGMDLSIKNVRERLKKWLRDMARRHHQSLQGELKSMIEEKGVWRNRRRFCPEEVHRRVRDPGLRTGAEAVGIIREDRNGR